MECERFLNSSRSLTTSEPKKVEPFRAWFIDDNRRTLGLDALHHTLNGALAEVVGVGLHGQAIHTNHGLMFLAGIPFAVGAIGTSKLEYAVGDEVFTGGVRIHDRLDEVLRHVLVVGEQLLRVLRQAVAAVTEARVVVMRADARVEAHAVDDLARVQAFDSA